MDSTISAIRCSQPGPNEAKKGIDDCDWWVRHTFRPLVVLTFLAGINFIASKELNWVDVAGWIQALLPSSQALNL